METLAAPNCRRRQDNAKAERLMRNEKRLDLAAARFHRRRRGAHRGERQRSQGAAEEKLLICRASSGAFPRLWFMTLCFMQKRAARTYTVIVRPCSIDKGTYRWVISSSDGEHEEFSPCSYFIKAGAKTAGDYRVRALTAADAAPLPS
ncbi:hypothetical protein MPC4_290035 [Methylocella tundrae]|uniref:Uncharacterized protein n=1 Tax=Methylocella tundrae TaxID=227605 RepID=A0A8B6M7Q9_METTU|nr:hypothetical protein MPC4_290035 [Methylocella tundrae]